MMPSVEADESIRARHQIAHHRQTRIGREFIKRQVASLGTVGTGVQTQPARSQRLQLGISHAAHRFINAIEINPYPSFKRRRGEANGMPETRLIGPRRDQHAELLAL